MSDITPSNLPALVEAFYQKATMDPLIGHFFQGLDLVAHLPVITSFWQSVLFGSGPYQGNPMEVHHHLHREHPMQPEHFERWLEHWNQTIRSLHAGPKSDEALLRASTIAGIMQSKLSGLAPNP